MIKKDLVPILINSYENIDVFSAVIRSGKIFRLMRSTFDANHLGCMFYVVSLAMTTLSINNPGSGLKMTLQLWFTNNLIIDDITILGILSRMLIVMVLMTKMQR